MTGTTSASQSANDTTANARTVETFLYALQDEDYDTADSALADNIVWQNVGYHHHARPEAHHEAVPAR